MDSRAKNAQQFQLVHKDTWHCQEYDFCTGQHSESCIGVVIEFVIFAIFYPQYNNILEFKDSKIY